MHFQMFNEVETIQRSKDKWNFSSEVNNSGFICISKETYFN